MKFPKSFLGGLSERAGMLVVIGLVAGFVAFGAGVAQAKVVRINGRAYGVTFRSGRHHLAGLAAISGPAEDPLIYGGGPLMLTSNLYLIFWGPSGSFATSYEGPIVQWAKDLAAAESTSTDEFSIIRQYKDASQNPITGTVNLAAAIDDTDPYPAKQAPCTTDSSSCLTDAQLQTEILHEISAQGWPTDAPATPHSQYIILTPNGVDGCVDGTASDCTFGSNGYCGYHSEITTGSGNVAIYSAVPYESGCDSGQAPAGVDGNPDTDGSLDTLIHEVAESATDPDGWTGYLDPAGYEIGDKCDGSVLAMTPSEIYGVPLGGSLAGNNAFNQLINRHAYYTQQLWSNAPTTTPFSSTAAGCVQRLGPSPSFAPPTSVTTGTAGTFDGSGSYDLAAPITRYTWNFGDGSPAQSGSSTPAHVYDKAGAYTVSLTVADATGSASASTESAPVTVTGPTLVPSISGFSPASAITGSKLTISGTNLASAASVKVNDLTAKIVSDTSSQIVATVPNGASSGPVTIKTAGGSATSPTSLIVTLAVTGFTPASGPAGTLVTITGAGFNSGSTVKLNGAPATTVTFVSPTELQAVVPSGATTGALTVTNSTTPVGTVRSAKTYIP